MICSSVSAILPLACAIAAIELRRARLRAAPLRARAAVRRLIWTRFFFHSSRTPSSSRSISSISLSLAACCAVRPPISSCSCAIALAQLRLLAVARAAPQLEQLAFAVDDRARRRDRPVAREQLVGKVDRCRRRRARLSSRALRASSSSSPLVTIARLARVTVSSSRTTMSPALTRSPSRTRSSPTTPPVGCCTFLTLESTTIEPGAITAPDNSRGRRPAADAADQHDDDDEPGQQMTADRAGAVVRHRLLSFMTSPLPLSGTTLSGRGPAGVALQHACASTSSFGPKACARPWSITSSRSTPASALGRCATTTTMPPRARTPRMAWLSASSPSASRLEFGSSSTTRNGSP